VDVAQLKSNTRYWSVVGALGSVNGSLVLSPQLLGLSEIQVSHQYLPKRSDRIIRRGCS